LKTYLATKIILQLPGLTRETFLAVRQTCQAITGLAKYLINFCGFNYVLLGKIQSDTIEGRFGRIRQLSGANYYISMRQLLESDRKLRTLSLVKYSKISVKDIEQAAQANHTADHEVTSKAQLLYGDLQFNILPTENDVGIIYYVTGYCCRSLVRSNKCEKCKEVTVADVNNSTESMMFEIAHDFFKDINRGGLWKPTPELYEVGCLCWRIFAELSTECMRQNFLNSGNQRDIFKEIVTVAFYECVVVSPWSVAAMCEKGHNILEGIAIRFFNTMCKNLLREMNEHEPAKVARKIRKLAGRNAKN